MTSLPPPTMPTAPFTALVEALPATVPFVGPETLERAEGRPFLARLGANESVFGPSPLALEAMAKAARDVWMYGDPSQHALREALAAHLGIDAGHVMIGSGIDGLLGDTCRLFVEQGSAVVSSLGGYPTFAYHAQGYGGALHLVPYRNDCSDLDALAQTAQREGARLVYLANPDNPMGSWHSAEAINTLLAGLPEDCLLLLDEAYIETAQEGTALPLAPEDPRLLRFRTFSKLYGLAGLRVGYVIGAAPIIAAYDKIRHHFGVGRIAQAGALAALADQAHAAEVLAQVVDARSQIAAIARSHGLTPLPSATNFVTIDCGGDGQHAAAVLDGLIASGIFVRKPMAPRLDRCIRISCGTPEDLRHLSEALAEVMMGLQA
ncbi:MAG: pyridoxal phosphate-dependent aminotransferase [Neomegalonema sp.]|nr:pyridoxal phosphate-dependent aminotransferase [Neomegalonema sp.]